MGKVWRESYAGKWLVNELPGDSAVIRYPFGLRANNNACEPMRPQRSGSRQCYLWADVDEVAGFDVELDDGCEDEDEDQDFCWCQELYFGSCSCACFSWGGAAGLGSECDDCTGCWECCVECALKEG